MSTGAWRDAYGKHQTLQFQSRRGGRGVREYLVGKSSKGEKGQYFTPQAVIEAGVRLLEIEQEDLLIDPACGTGGFLVQSIFEIKRIKPDLSDQDLSRWAREHVFGIEKDAIGVKLAKAVMQIAGDGAAHIVRGVHAMIPKSLFVGELRQKMAVV